MNSSTDRAVLRKQNNFHGIAGCHGPISITDEWITPKFIIDALGPFDLDPCCAMSMPWRTAERWFTVADDGLAQPWSGYVWCNPPYGKNTGVWLQRLKEHGNGIALIFARTETRMFFEYVWAHASALLFIEGRLTFYRPDGTLAPHNSGGPSVLVAYGDKAAHRLVQSGLAGACIE